MNCSTLRVQVKGDKNSGDQMRRGQRQRPPGVKPDQQGGQSLKRDSAVRGREATAAAEAVGSRGAGGERAGSEEPRRGISRGSPMKAPRSQL